MLPLWRKTQAGFSVKTSLSRKCFQRRGAPRQQCNSTNFATWRLRCRRCMLKRWKVEAVLSHFWRLLNLFAAALSKKKSVSWHFCETAELQNNIEVVLDSFLNPSLRERRAAAATTWLDDTLRPEQQASLEKLDINSLCWRSFLVFICGDKTDTPHCVFFCSKNFNWRLLQSSAFVAIVVASVG